MVKKSGPCASTTAERASTSSEGKHGKVLASTFGWQWGRERWHKRRHGMLTLPFTFYCSECAEREWVGFPLLGWAGSKALQLASPPATRYLYLRNDAPALCGLTRWPTSTYNAWATAIGGPTVIKKGAAPVLPMILRSISRQLTKNLT